MGAAPKGTGAAVAAARPAPRQLWSAEPFTIDVRRYGEDWIPLANVRAGRNMVLTLPYLSSDVPWEIRANGACDITPEATGS